MTTHALGAARQAHSARCRQRVIKALNDAVAAGEEISVSAIARRARVNRSFLYNHRDLHASILAKAAEPPTASTGGPAVSRASLFADLGNAHDRIARLTAENQHLRNRLSEALGEQSGTKPAWAVPPTSNNCSDGSPNSNSKPSNYAANSPTATTTSPPPAPPTATS